jgi:hypothetical protein
LATDEKIDLFILPVNISDMLGSAPVQYMDDTQFRWYFRLLCYAWTNKKHPCKLLNTDEQLMIDAGCKSRKLWDAKKKLVLDRFTVSIDGKYLIHDRLEIEREKVLQLTEKRRQAGKDGAAARWQTHGNRMAEPEQKIAPRPIPTLIPKPTPTLSECEMEPPSDSDEKILTILKRHPRSVLTAPRQQQAVMNAWVAESSTRGSDAAYEYLLGRTDLYRKMTSDWPPGDRRYICTADKWFEERKYAESEEFWKKGNANAFA